MAFTLTPGETSAREMCTATTNDKGPLKLAGPRVTTQRSQSPDRRTLALVGHHVIHEHDVARRVEQLDAGHLVPVQIGGL